MLEKHFLVHCYIVLKKDLGKPISCQIDNFEKVTLAFTISSMKLNHGGMFSKALLGVVIDSEVTFAKHTGNLCQKTKQKLHALARVANFMTLEKRRLVMKKFVFSQFDYRPLVWMCHNRKLNNKLNRL